MSKITTIEEAIDLINPLSISLLLPKADILGLSPKKVTVFAPEIAHKKREIQQKLKTIHDEALLGYLTSLKTFIDNGKMDINAQNKYGSTLLLLAIKTGQYKMAQELIKAGADVRIKDMFHQTALMLAAERGKMSLVRNLLNKQATLHDQDKNKQTALDKALKNNHIEIAALLIRHGSPVSHAQQALLTPRLQKEQKRYQQKNKTKPLLFLYCLAAIKRVFHFQPLTQTVQKTSYSQTPYTTHQSIKAR